MQQFYPSLSDRFVERLWDAWCIASIIGIWPRFIEPSLLWTTHHTLPISSLPEAFDGLRIVQISDLHHTPSQSKKFLQRIEKKIAALNPDLILFTGDILSYSHMEEPQILQDFLTRLRAPLGTYAIFGNHDYAEFVTLAEDNTYRRIRQHIPAIMKGFYRLLSKPSTTTADPEVQDPIALHTDLISLYRQSNVTVLHNETVKIGSKNAYIQLTGLGDIAAKQCLPEQAFATVNTQFPTIVLSHNPDSYSRLARYPGDLFLFGHTHGGQVNIPYMWQKVTDIQDKRFKSGIFYLNNRFLYVNRGLGSPFPFRWFAPPEIALFTLVSQGLAKEVSWEAASPEPVTGSLYEPTA